MRRKEFFLRLGHFGRMNRVSFRRVSVGCFSQKAERGTDHAENF